MPKDAYVVGAIDIYEIKAAAFRRCTGLMAPGKDAAAADHGAAHETRQAVWDLWIEMHGAAIQAVIDAAIKILPPIR